MASPPDAASAAASARANVMGQLRCVIEKHGRRKLSGYKKRFWVVNYRTKRLEVYKNDQSHEPANVYRAEDIKGVIYSGDKQDKFFVMIVQTRLKHDIKFRMSSLEEREKWSRAITRLIDAFSMTHRRNNIFEFLQRRTRTVSRSLNANIGVDWPRLLTAPPEVLEYTVEAVDCALASVAALVRGYGNEIPVPRSYTLNVYTLESTPTGAHDFPGPQYDPIKSSAVMSVVLYKDALGRVKFYVTDPEEVISIMQSNVFRNPLVEGWIANSPGCAEACEEIRRVLNRKNKPFPITFQWGQYLGDTDTTPVEAYLEKFVNVAFFRRVLGAVKDTLRDVARMLEDVTSAPAAAGHSAGTSPALTPRGNWAAGGSSSSFAAGPAGGAAPTLASHGRSFSATLFFPQDLTTSTGGGGATSHRASATYDGDDDASSTATHQYQHQHHHGQGHTGTAAAPAATAADLHAMAVQLLSGNITGLAITLERRIVEEGRFAPLVVVEHTPEYETRSRPSFLLAAKYRQIYAQPVDAAAKSALSEQLFGVAFHALLSRQISVLRARLNAVCRGKIKVAIMWDRLLQVFHALHAPLTPRDLPRLVNALADFYLPRLTKTIQLLKSSAPAGASSSSPHGTASPARRSLVGDGGGGEAAVAATAVALAGEEVDVDGLLYIGGAADSIGGGGLSWAGSARVIGDDPHTSGGGGGGGGGDGYLDDLAVSTFDVMSHCVGGIVVDFYSYPDLITRRGDNPEQPSVAVAAAAIPEPSVQNGSLVDNILCADDATVAAMVNAVSQLRGGGPSSSLSKLFVRGVTAFPACPRIGTWCQVFFSSPDHVAACIAAPRRVIEDEFASGSDDDEDDAAASARDGPGLDLVGGEAVANERRAEISVLNLHRVVNTIYDSQGDSVDLKIGAQHIRAAIHALQRAFAGKKVTMHDTMRVLTVNLRRLRHMYSRAAYGEDNAFLDEAAATRLLKEFCEYAATEAVVDATLPSYCGELFRARTGTAGMARNPEDCAGGTTTTGGGPSWHFASGPLSPVGGGGGASGSERPVIAAPAVQVHIPQSSVFASGPGGDSPISNDSNSNRIGNSVVASPTSTSASPRYRPPSLDRRGTLPPSDTRSSASPRHRLPPPQAHPSAAGHSTSDELHPSGSFLPSTTPLQVEKTGTFNNHRSDSQGTRAPGEASGGSGGGGGRTTTATTSTTTIGSTSPSGPRPVRPRMAPLHDPRPRNSAAAAAYSDADADDAPAGGSSRQQQRQQQEHAIPTASIVPPVTPSGHDGEAPSPNDGDDDDDDDDDALEGSGRRLYDFQAFSGVALAELLPREAVIARRAWRTGLVFGLESAGKSHLINCIQQLPRLTVATVGLSRQVVAFDEWVFSLNELGGRENFRKNWRFYAKRLDDVAFLLNVVDCSSAASYEEAIRYLKEVAKHFLSAPLLIVFNNYQVSPYRKPLKDLAWEYEVDKVQKLAPKRPIFLCTHELSVLHPAARRTAAIPSELYARLRELSNVLLSRTEKKERPIVPKDVEEWWRENGIRPNDHPPQPQRQFSGGGGGCGGSSGAGGNGRPVFTGSSAAERVSSYSGTSASVCDSTVSHIPF